MTTRPNPVTTLDVQASLTRNILALTSGLALWTAVHFGVTAVLPLFLHDQGYDARGIGFMLGAMGVAQVILRPLAGWIVDAFGRRIPLVLSLVLLAGASGLLLSPVGWAVLANRLLTGAAYSLGTTAFFTLVVESAPPGRQGEVQGYVALGITLGVGLGPAAAVALYHTLYGVAFVILPSLAGDAVPATGRGAAINTMGLGADLAQLLGPSGLGLAAGTWGFGGALVAAGVVPLAGAIVYLAHAHRGRPSPSTGAATARV